MSNEPTRSNSLPEPIPAERLDAIRALDLATLVPHSSRWTDSAQGQYRRFLQMLKPVLHELLDEIEALDAELGRADTENERLAALVPQPQPVRASAVRVERVAKGWRTRWREGSTRRTRTFPSRRDAAGYADFLRHEAMRSGAL